MRIGLYPYNASNPKCDIPWSPITREKNNNSTIILNGSKLMILEKFNNTNSTARSNKIVCKKWAYKDGFINIFTNLSIVIYTISKYKKLSLRRQVIFISDLKWTHLLFYYETTYDSFK